MEDLKGLFPANAPIMSIQDRLRLATAIALVKTKPPHLSNQEWLSIQQFYTDPDRKPKAKDQYSIIPPEEALKGLVIHLMGRIEDMERRQCVKVESEEKDIDDEGVAMAGPGGTGRGSL